MKDFAFAMKEDAAVGKMVTYDDGKPALIEPKAVSDFYYTRYALSKIVSFHASGHQFINSPLTQGICQVLGINTVGVTTWDLAFVRPIIRPFLTEHKIDHLCNDPTVKKNLLEEE